MQLPGGTWLEGAQLGNLKLPCGDWMTRSALRALAAAGTPRPPQAAPNRPGRARPPASGLVAPGLEVPGGLARSDVAFRTRRGRGMGRFQP